MKVLITGFQPFGTHTLNPTALLVEALKNNQVVIPSSMTVEGLVLPVTFDTSFSELKRQLQLCKPDIVLCLGLAGRRESIELERVAINCMDAYIPDNQGHQPRDQKIDNNGETAYFSTLPLRHLEAQLLKAKVPARISNSAGTYVCNYVFYKLAQELQTTQVQFGFIHVPPIPEQNELVSMRFDLMLKGLETILLSLSTQGSLSVE